MAVILAPARGKKLTGMPTEGLIVLVGLPKAGKTHFVASFPDSVILELEKGGGDRVAGRIQDVKTLQEFREYFKAAIDDPEIKVIGVDTVDRFNDLIEDDIAQARGLSTISERKAGVDGFELWGEHRQRITGFVEACKNCGKLVVVLAHCRDPKLSTDGSVMIPSGVNMPGKSGPYLAAQADAIGYHYKKQIGGQTQYFLTFQGGPLGTWGSRIEELEDKTIQLSKSDPYGSFASIFKTNGKAQDVAPAKTENKKKGGK